jgi:hypothetical protein
MTALTPTAHRFSVDAFDATPADVLFAASASHSDTNWQNLVGLPVHTAGGSFTVDVAAAGAAPTFIGIGKWAPVPGGVRYAAIVLPTVLGALAVALLASFWPLRRAAPVLDAHRASRYVLQCAVGLQRRDRIARLLWSSSPFAATNAYSTYTLPVRILMLFLLPMNCLFVTSVDQGTEDLGGWYEVAGGVRMNDVLKTSAWVSVVAYAIATVFYVAVAVTCPSHRSIHFGICPRENPFVFPTTGIVRLVPTVIRVALLMMWVVVTTAVVASIIVTYDAAYSQRWNIAVAGFALLWCVVVLDPLRVLVTELLRREPRLAATSDEFSAPQKDPFGILAIPTTDEADETRQFAARIRRTVPSLANARRSVHKG